MYKSLTSAAAVLLLSCAAHGQPTTQPTTLPTGRSAHVTVTLVSDALTIAPAQPFTVALHFAIDPDWHLYWKDPGDSGLPPRVTWSLPEGFVAGELLFPAPQTVNGPAGVNFEFEGEVTLLATIAPPATLAPRTSVPISAALKWLECNEDRCVPAKAPVAIHLNTAEVPTANAAAADQFNQWRAMIELGKTFVPKPH